LCCAPGIVILFVLFTACFAALLLAAALLAILFHEMGGSA
jgi:hypothetical protein